MDSFLNSTLVTEFFNKTLNETFANKTLLNETFDDLPQYVINATQLHKQIQQTEAIPYTVLFIFTGLVVGGKCSLFSLFTLALSVREPTVS